MKTDDFKTISLKFLKQPNDLFSLNKYITFIKHSSKTNEKQFCFNVGEDVEKFTVSTNYELNQNSLQISNKSLIKTTSSSINIKNNSDSLNSCIDENYKNLSMFVYLTNLQFNHNNILINKKEKEVILNKKCLIRNIYNQFFTVGFHGELFLAYIEDNVIYLMNYDFLILKIISLKNVKKITIRKKAEVMFCYEEKKNNKLISLINADSRTVFLKELLSSSNCYKKFEEVNLMESTNINKINIEFSKRFIISIFDLEDKDFNFKYNDNSSFNLKYNIIRKFCELMKNDLEKSFYFYKFTNNGKKQSIFNLYNMNFSNKKKLLITPFLTTIGSVKRIFDIIFFNYNFTRINLTNSVIYWKAKKKFIRDILRSSKMEMNQRREKRDKDAMKRIKNRPRKEIEKKKKKLTSEKAVYKGLHFKVCTSKSSNVDKEGKILELSTGVIKYYKEKDKVIFFNLGNYLRNVKNIQN